MNISIEEQVEIIKDYNNKIKPKDICKKYNIKYSFLCNLLFRKDVYKKAKQIQPIIGLYSDSVKPFEGLKEKEYQKNYHLNNLELRRDKQLYRKYKIYINDYNKMLENQNYKCSICDKHYLEEVTNLCIDHCHNTGKIRGLLCNSCNKGLGHFKDNLTFLNNAIKYLKLNG